jgi:hypothetical protein
MEYKILLLTGDPEPDTKTLNQAAGDGWELREFLVVPGFRPNFAGLGGQASMTYAVMGKSA